MEDKLIQEMRNNKEINKCCYCEYTSYRGCNIKNGNLYNPNNNCVYFVPNENKIADYKIEKLEQQLEYKIAENKQMGEALEKVKKDACCSNGDCEHCEYDEDCFGYDAQQALNQANTREKLKQLTELSQEYGLYDDVKEGE